MNDEQNIGLPLVSIIITSYNREKYIAQTIESALSQDYQNLEIIINDNASTDSTDTIIKKYVPDKRIKYFRNESNIGMIGNFKLASERANGKFITYLSSDDYFINNFFISESISLVNKYENILLVLARQKSLYISTNKEETGPGFDDEFYRGTELFLQFPKVKTFSWAAALMHRDTLLSFKPFEKRYTSIDVMSNLRLMLLGNMAFLDKPSYLVRYHDNNATISVNLPQAIENFSYILEPYNAALKIGNIPKQKLEKWKVDSIFLFARATSVLFAAQSKSDYDSFMRYTTEHFPGVHEKLRLNFKWNVLIFFFKRPKFSLRFFNLFSKSHYDYLRKLIENGKRNLSEKVKL